MRASRVYVSGLGFKPLGSNGFRLHRPHPALPSFRFMALFSKLLLLFFIIFSILFFILILLLIINIII